MRIFYCVLSLFIMCWCGVSHAGCRTSSSTTSFGSVSSFRLASDAQKVESGSGFSCSGSQFSLGGTNTVTVTISRSANGSGNSARLHNSQEGGYIPYKICGDSSCRNILSIGSSKTWRSSSYGGLLGYFNAVDGTLPLFMSTQTGVNVPAGRYTDTLTLLWRYHICSYGFFGVCIYTDGTAVSSVSLSMDVDNDCLISSAPDINFGSASFPSDFRRVSSVLGVRCTKNASYRISLISLNPESGDWRQMKNDSFFLQYQLYQPDGSLWSNNRDLTTTGSGETQLINYSARVNPTQPDKPEGFYQDTVTVTVEY